MMVADVDNDQAQEVIYGAGMFQSDGSFGCATGFGHGDALHVTDLVPSRPGLEVFMPHEDESKPWWDVRQAEDCIIIAQSSDTGEDNGRGAADDIDADNPGAEFWSASDGALRSATSGAVLNASKPSQVNFLDLVGRRRVARNRRRHEYPQRQRYGAVYVWRLHGQQHDQVDAHADGRLVR